jgi:hypothetical protein
MSKKLKPSDFVLLLLYVDSCSSIRGNTRFQKLAFVFEKEIYKQKGFDKLNTEPNLFNFEAYKFGPFSKNLLKHIDFFVTFDVVERKNISCMDKDFYIDSSAMEYGDEDNENASNYYEYFLTSKGKQYIEKNLLPLLTDEQLDILVSIKQQFNGIDLDTILGYVYTKYKDMTINSEILEEVLNKTNGKEAEEFKYDRI